MSTTLLKNVASQRVRVYAYTPADGNPKTGDAANLTAYIAKDYGAVTALTDTSATEEDATNAPGYYWFDISQTESNADNIMVTAKSSTSGVKVLGAPAIIGTRPATGFLAPATAGRTLVVDAAGLADANAVKLGPSGSGTAQTARDIGASVLLSNGTGTGQVKIASGYLAMTWADIGSPTTVVNLSGTTVKTATDVETDTADIQTRLPAALVSGRMDSSVGAMAANTITAAATAADFGAEIATAVWTDTTAGDFTVALSVGKSVMNGVSLGTGLTVASVSGAVGSVTGAVGSVTAGVTVTTNNDKTGYALSAAGVAAIWDALTSGMTTVGSIGKKLADWTIHSAADVWAAATRTLTAATNITSTGGTTVPQTGDAYAIVNSGTHGNAALKTLIDAVDDYLDTEIAAIKAKTDNLPADPADASDVAAAIAALSVYTTRVVARCTVGSASSTTSIVTSACSPSGAVADQFKGRIVVFDNDTTTAALRGQATDITASSNSATPTLTVTALTTAPASGDTFSIV